MKANSIPERLFRFRSLANDEIAEREVKALEQSYLFASPFSGMNDPMEAFYQTGRPEDLFIDAMLSSGGKGTRDLYAKLDAMIARFALVSFSSTHMDLPMWAYYASNFAGMCLEFDSAALAIGDFHGEKLRGVTYAMDALPSLGFVDLAPDRLDEAVMARISRKREEWRHEKEWRYIVGEAGPKHFLDDGLTRVYVGPRAKIEHVNRICAVLRDRPVEVLQGETVGFNLQFHTIKPAAALGVCERVGTGSFDRARDLYDEKELSDFLSVPIDVVIAECERTAARPNFEAFRGIGISGPKNGAIYCHTAYKLRSGREVYHKRYFDRRFQPREAS